MRPPFVLPDLPEGTHVVVTPRAVLACRPEAREDLERVGYGPESDGRRVVSDVAGRRALDQFDVDGRRYLVRRFLHGGLLRGLTGERFADPTRPFQELVAAHRLAVAGIPTAPVVAARARSLTGPGWQLEVVMPRLEGQGDLADLLDRRRSGDLGEPAWRTLVRAAGEAVRDLHAAGFDHADLQPANLLVDASQLATEPPPRVAVLDLDRGSFPEPFERQHRLANLERFVRWVDLREARRGPAVRPTDRARFLAAYEPERGARHSLARDLLRLATQSKARHGLGHRIERLFGLRRSR